MKKIGITHNSFEPINNNKTLYRLMYGVPIVDKTIFVTSLEYLPGKSNAFVITSRGQHVCTMASIGDGFYVGRFKEESFLAHRSDSKFELFCVDLDTRELEVALKGGKLSDAMAEARKSALKVLNLTIIPPNRKYVRKSR